MHCGYAAPPQCSTSECLRATDLQHVCFSDTRHLPAHAWHQPRFRLYSQVCICTFLYLQRAAQRLPRAALTAAVLNLRPVTICTLTAAQHVGSSRPFGLSAPVLKRQQGGCMGRRGIAVKPVCASPIQQLQQIFSLG